VGCRPGLGSTCVLFVDHPAAPSATGAIAPGVQPAARAGRSSGPIPPRAGFGHHMKNRAQRRLRSPDPSTLKIMEAPMHPGRPQILIFTYHKSGTTLFDHIMRTLAVRHGFSIRVQYGMAYDIDRNADIVLLPHSLLGFTLARPFRAVRVVRDPRDIWISSYLYHRRTNEGWCVNTNFDPTPPIIYPRVDFSMVHRPERWKRRWLAQLGGKSYQQNLLERDMADGLAFELAGYTRSTLAAMQVWRGLPGVLDVKLEDIAANFDGTMTVIFRHLNLSGSTYEAAMQIAASEDIKRMDDATLAANPHIYCRQLSKWRDILTEAQIREFVNNYGGLLLDLGYMF
jgi:hypothetical protein